MKEWLINNKVWLFDGIGVVILVGIITWLNNRYKIVKGKEIKEYKKQISALTEENKKLGAKVIEYEDKDKQSEGLEYDSKEEIYYKTDKGIITYYCPRCKDVDNRLVHLDKHTDTIGNLFICKNCNKPFGKGCFPTEDSSYNDIFS